MEGYFYKTYRRTLRISAGLCGVAIIGFNTLPHLFPMKTMLATQKVPCGAFDISAKHKQLLEETCDHMSIDRSKVDVFYTNGFSTHSVGFLYGSNKALIGIPRNAMYKTTDDVQNGRIFFNNKPIDWESNIGKAFMECMIFDDKNIKFLLGHELTHIKDSDFLLNTGHAVGLFYGFYQAALHLPNIMQTSSFGRIAVGNILLWALGIQIYLTTKKMLSHRSEFVADEKSARIAQDYCEGGMSYMRNRLKLNRILRKMHGEQGETMFSKAGNNLKDTETHPARTERLKKLKEILNEYSVAISNHNDDA